jgi:chemotaxis protein MotB
MSSTSAPVIIKRVKRVHGGHHGGAWKVAYADFVTAMMALFIVLWLMNTSEEVQQAIGGYFRDPSGTGSQTGSGAAGTGENLSVGTQDLNKLKEKIDQAMREIPEFDKRLKDQVQMTVTGEGLRIELMESETGVFFETGNSHPTSNAEKLLGVLAAELAKMQNKVVIEGHTDARPFAADARYSNWELSAERANMARRLMRMAGMRPDQITQVRGFAEQKLKNPGKPDDTSNRRVSVVVQYVPGQQQAPVKPAAAQQHE